MSWLRIDDDFASHPKIAALTDRELRVWLRVLCSCARAKDPTVDRLTMKEIPGLTPRLVSKFESVCLLDSVQNAYEIHDWVQYQPRDETGAERQARYRARRQEQAKDPRDVTVTETVTETVTPNRYATVTSRAGARARPVPSRPPTTSSNSEPVPEPEANYDGAGAGSGDLERLDPHQLLEHLGGLA